MRTTTSSQALAAAAIGLVALVPLFGCSGNGLNLVKVGGKVTYRGKPIQNGTVFFMPDDTKGTIGPPAVGSITEDGSYVMSTESAGDGVIVGSHRIGITGLEPKPISDGAVVDPESAPEAYLKSKAKSAATARTGAAETEEDVMTDRGGRKFRLVVPRKFSNPMESGIIVKVDRSATVNFDIDDSGNVRVSQ
jgi:hypothetical protein